MILWAIARIHVRTWNAVLVLGIPFALILVLTVSAWRQGEAGAIAVQIPLYALISLGLPVRMLATGASRRMMPGHDRAAALLIAVIAVIAAVIGVGLAWAAGMPLLVAAATAGLSVAGCLWLLRLHDSPYLLMPLFAGAALSLRCAEYIRTWLQADPLHAAATAACAIALAVAAVLGLARMPGREQPISGDGPQSWTAFDLEQPGWLLRRNPSGLRGQVLQPWDPLRLGLLGGGLVGGTALLGLACDRLLLGGGSSERMVALFANGGAALALILVIMTMVILASRGNRLLAALLVRPGGDRRGIATRLVHAGMGSALEVMLCLGGGSALTWRLCTGGARCSWSDLALAAGLTCIAVVAAAPLAFWLVVWLRSPWLRWVQVTMWLGFVIGCVYLILPATRTWHESGEVGPAVIAAIILLVLTGVFRLLAIRQLAAAQPA